MQVKAIFTGIGVGLYSKYETELKHSLTRTLSLARVRTGLRCSQLIIRITRRFNYICHYRRASLIVAVAIEAFGPSTTPSVAVALNLIRSVAFLEDAPFSTEHDHLKQQVWLAQSRVKDAAKSLRTVKFLSHSQCRQQKSRSAPLFISP